MAAFGAVAERQLSIQFQLFELIGWEKAGQSATAPIAVVQIIRP